VSFNRAKLEMPLSRTEKEKRAAWAGGEKHLCLAKGDRVVVIEGPYKGQIAPIQTIKKDTMSVTLQNAAMVSPHNPAILTLLDRAYCCASVTGQYHDPRRHRPEGTRKRVNDTLQHTHLGHPPRAPRT
jgi:hypothetical protein